MVKFTIQIGPGPGEKGEGSVFRTLHVALPEPAEGKPRFSLGNIADALVEAAKDPHGRGHEYTISMPGGAEIRVAHAWCRDDAIEKAREVHQVLLGTDAVAITWKRDSE